jgi:adenylate kinase
VALNILILGAQGAGKGTQAKRIARAHGIPHIATGEILRAAMAEGTELGRQVQPIYDSGGLVPDELMIAIIADRLSHDDAGDGFVLDGFPRTLAQAEALDPILRDIGKELSVVFAFLLPDEVAVERILKRGSIEGRADDAPEAIARRLDLYHRETEPLIEWYRARSNVVTIHAERTVEEVFEEIQDALERTAVA